MWNYIMSTGMPPDARLSPVMPGDIIGGVDTMGQRLTFALAFRERNMAWLDIEIGMKSGYCTRIVRGLKKDPHARIIKRMSDALDISFEWLYFGTGEMLDTGGVTDTAESELLRLTLKGVTPPPPTNFEIAVKRLDGIVGKRVINKLRAEFGGRENERTPEGWVLELKKLGMAAMVDEKVLDEVKASKAS